MIKMDKGSSLTFYLPVNYLDDCEGLLLTKFPILDKTVCRSVMWCSGRL